jgi:hypothetical protein
MCCATFRVLRSYQLWSSSHSVSSLACNEHRIDCPSGTYIKVCVYVCVPISQIESVNDPMKKRVEGFWFTFKGWQSVPFSQNVFIPTPTIGR